MFINNCQTTLGLNQSQYQALIESIKSYLANSYDFNILNIRCKQSGRLLRVITDEELINLYQINQNNLAKLSAHLEYYVTCGEVASDWLVTNPDNLAYQRLINPKEFLNYCLKELIKIKLYSKLKNHKIKMSLTEINYLINSDFNILIESLENKLDFANNSLLNDLLDNLLLILCLDQLAITNSLLNDLSIESLVNKILDFSLIKSLNQSINSYLISYKLKNNLPLIRRLSPKDIDNLMKIKSKKARLFTKANNNDNIHNAQHFYDIKKQSTKDIFFDRLIGELESTININKFNLTNAKISLINKLVKQQTNQQLGKPSIKSIDLNKLKNIKIG